MLLLRNTRCHKPNGKMNVISCKRKCGNVSDKAIYFWKYNRVESIEKIHIYLLFYVICTNFKRDISGRKYVVLNYYCREKKFDIFECDFSANVYIYLKIRNYFISSRRDPFLIYLVMFVNRIFGNYYCTSYAGGGSDGVVGRGVLSACPQLKLIAFAEVDYVHLNSRDREQARESARGHAAFPRYRKNTDQLKDSWFPINSTPVPCRN